MPHANLEGLEISLQQQDIDDKACCVPKIVNRAATASSEDLRHRESPLPPTNIAFHEIPSVAATMPTRSSIAMDSEPTVVENRENTEHHHVQGLPLVLLTAGLCTTTFAVALDSTILATAIPKITSQFSSLDDVGWYGSSYLLITTSLQPIFGKLYSFFNVKLIFMISLLVFEIGSIVCAIAGSSVVLIIGRAIAGLGAAGLFSGGITLVSYSVPLHKRALYLGLISSMWGVSSFAGPLAGGAITDATNLTWRWCFWINLPFGSLAFLVVLLFFKNPTRQDDRKQLREKLSEMDLLGALLFIGATVSLLLALQWGGTTYSWRDSKVWGNLLGSAVFVVFFGLIQWRRQDKATIPPRFLRQRSVAVGCGFAGLLSMGSYVQIYFLPFYFQSVKGLSAEGSAVRTIPLLVSDTVGSIVSGGLITLLGFYSPFMWIGSIIYTVGSGLLHTLNVNTNAAHWIGYQIVAGFARGLSVQVPFFSSQVVLKAKDMPIGNALTMFSNSLGGALAVSIAQNLFSNTLLEALHADSGLTQSEIAQIFASGATDIRQVTSSANILAVLEAYDTAITQALTISIAAGGLAFVASLFMEWKTIKGKTETASEES